MKHVDKYAMIEKARKQGVSDARCANDMKCPWHEGSDMHTAYVEGYTLESKRLAPKGEA